MGQISTDVIKSSLLKKGFLYADKDHTFYYFYYKGKKTNIRTKISHGSGYKNYPEKLIKEIKKQLYFEKLPECKNFLKCIMTQSQYIDMLIKQKIIT